MQNENSNLENNEVVKMEETQEYFEGYEVEREEAISSRVARKIIKEGEDLFEVELKVLEVLLMTPEDEWEDFEMKFISNK